ncbi:hypothetical protein SEA_BIANMAT_69 [Gordonia phage Bianmat]|nr:hypothetical protein SEA_BIANMAT_69 [Gordonia phage Bianmat]
MLELSNLYNQNYGVLQGRASRGDAAARFRNPVSPRPWQ